MSESRRALVLGGTGFFGSRLVEDLLAHTDLDITTVSRRRRGLDTASSRVSHVVADIRDQAALREVMRGHGLVLHAAGPFEKMPIAPLDAVIDLGIDYVDISENRLFRNTLIERSERIAGSDIRVMNGSRSSRA
jgi:saccharopine dehydrogenase-like NADP-dependent oxidoreductase